MRVILTINNQPADLEAGYALRLIEQGRAIPLRQPPEEEKQVAEVLHVEAPRPEPEPQPAEEPKPKAKPARNKKAGEGNVAG